MGATINTESKGDAEPSQSLNEVELEHPKHMFKSMCKTKRQI